ncbi:hypothetical protein QN277_000205 [Acacia crassicarpa]|uniref:Uncharacterized protein n=1 Tax=Acacia crassicarpa TaxID=499986 RepID=A0AAE1N4L6_9FABA|nr:hypothetical protein QN277_000205 [Acacia crassicarpa]
MKTNVLLAFFFFFSIALFAITTAEIVYDSDGHLLQNGGNYCLLPPGLGGQSIKRAGIDKSDGSCSLAVVLKLSYKKGWLTNIASPYFSLHITTDFPLWIKFAQLPLNTCTKNPPLLQNGATESYFLYF